MSISGDSGLSQPYADARYTGRGNIGLSVSPFSPTRVGYSSVVPSGITYTSSATMAQTINTVTATGLAQGGTLTSIQLASTASPTDGTYSGQRINILAGTGVGQTAICGQYVGSTRTATITGWTAMAGRTVVAPDATSAFAVVPVNLIGIYGINQAFLGEFGASATHVVDLCAPSALASTFQLPDLTWTFRHMAGGTSPGIDLKMRGNGQAVDLWIDGAYIGHYDTAVSTGTALAGTSGSITLAAGESATVGNYNECWVRITGGTGTLGETKFITNYNATTKICTIFGTWSVTPDLTTTYSIDQSPAGIALDGATDTLKFLHIPYSAPGPHDIRIVTPALAGLVIGATDAITPGPADSEESMLMVADSYWQGITMPSSLPRMSTQLCDALGLQKVHLAIAGTGWENPNFNTTAAIPFGDRIIPPGIVSAIPGDAQSAYINASAGTYTISVTAGGTTLTTGTLAFNAAASTVIAALQALTNVHTDLIYVAGGGGLFGRPTTAVIHHTGGCSIVFNPAGLTGSLVQCRYYGDVINNIPKDVNGNPVPWLLFVPGSGNDESYGAASVQTFIQPVLQNLISQFSTCIPIIAGMVSNSTDQTNGILDAYDITYQAMFASMGALLPLYNGKVPLIDPYYQGLGGKNIVYGSGTIGGPTNNTNDRLKSILKIGHPGDGGTFWASWFIRQFQKMLSVK